MTRKCVVVSAVNFSEGGPLTVLQDCLSAAINILPLDWQIIALVHDKKLVNQTRVHCIEFPNAKRSWLLRLYYEWFVFFRLSKKVKPDLWLSLHDITPRVLTRRQVVYCHNPSPFYHITLHEAILEPKFLLFNWFYKYLYRINIHCNYAVVVQQNWLRSKFLNLYQHPNVIVAHPMPKKLSHLPLIEAQTKKIVFLYPALPRVFKNIEILCQAAVLLSEEAQSGIEIRLTIDGTENRYARNLVQRFGGVKALRFLGRQSRDDMAMHYAQCNTVLFPSKLETWGLPISEAKAMGKPLIVANLPYAYETIGTYSSVTFLPPDDAEAWAIAIEEVAAGKWLHLGNVEFTPPPPYAADWQQLWTFLIEGL